MFKYAVLLSALVFLIPAEKQQKETGTPVITMGEAVYAAQQVYSDLTDFCERRENTCETGRYLVGQFKVKAHRGLELASNWLASEQNDLTPPQYPDPIATSSINKD